MKKKYIYLFILFICLLILIILLSILNNDENNGVVSKERQKYFDSLPDDYYGPIDFEQKDNVEIKNHQKFNISPKIKEKHTFKQYEVSNMEIFTVKSLCYITFDIKNLSYKGKDYQKLFVILYDSNGDIIESIDYEVNNHIKIGKTKNIVIEYLKDVSNAYDYKIETLYK